MSENRPRPRAFRLDDAKVAVDDAPAPLLPKATVRSQSALIPEAPAPGLDAGERDIEAAQATGLRRGWRLSLGALALSGLGGLTSLALSVLAADWIEGLFARAQALGWIGAAFAALLGLGVVGLGLREALALGRQKRIAELHAALAKARAQDDGKAARVGVTRLIALYAARPETARGRAEVREAMTGIVDGRDLIDIAERALLRPLDQRAQSEIASAAKRISMLTALSPRAVLDLFFVIGQLVWLTRRIAEIYGGRPGFLGFLRLARTILTHLTITGGLAVGDSVLQGLVGHGIASKISARLGEGVLNGVLTARVGLSALAVCRPAPFGVQPPPGVGDVAPFLFSRNETA